MKSLSQKQIIIIVSVVVLVLVIGGYLLYRAGKKSGFSPSKAKTDKDKVGAGTLSDEEFAQLEALAVSLYEDMNGANWNWDEKLYDDLGTKSDEALGVVNNVFNDKYEEDSGQTFRMWLQNEQFWWNDYGLQQRVNQIITRLVTIGAT